MRRSFLAFTLMLAMAALGLPGWAAPPERVAEPGSGGPRAVLQITSEDGVCYWQISGDDDLVRLPVKDDRTSAILLSARFEGQQLAVTLAGEREPLETFPLGRYGFNLEKADAAPVMVTGIRNDKAHGDGWELRVVREPITLAGCCGCSLQKVSCCPRAGKCLTCGTCGECCN